MENQKRPPGEKSSGQDEESGGQKPNDSDVSTLTDSAAEKSPSENVAKKPTSSDNSEESLGTKKKRWKSTGNTAEDDRKMPARPTRSGDDDDVVLLVEYQLLQNEKEAEKEAFEEQIAELQNRIAELETENRKPGFLRSLCNGCKGFCSPGDTNTEED